MKQFQYIVKDNLGIHARPAGLLAKEASRFESKLTLTRDDKTIELTRLIMIMSLGVKKGDEITISAQGRDEDDAIAAIQAFLEENL